LAELSDSAQHRQAFETLYVELQDLRALLSSGDYSTRMDQNARRLDILRSVASIFRCMESGFEGTSSGLSRIRDAGRRIFASDGYKRLTELLEYEGHHATVDLRVRLGMQGNVRAFEVVNYQENVDSALHTSWLKEIWNRLRMMLRGYRVTQHEMLSRLLDQTFEDVKSDVLPLFQLLGDMEFYLAGLGFIDMAHKAGLKPTFPQLVSRDDGVLSLRGLYNPFLLADGVDVRPCDVSAEADAIVIITGPNSGGKTRLLQSVALAQVLAQCGMMIPAAEGRIVWTEGLFVSLLNEVSADQREGRLGMELLRIRRLFEQINVGDMVVIDELCSGTNPSEGEEIFRLVIGLLGELHPQVWLTTHFLTFAQGLEASSDLEQLRFLQVKLDAHELPTFQF
jgi:DNA mismatch repair protein MutS2